MKSIWKSESDHREGTQIRRNAVVRYRPAKVSSQMLDELFKKMDDALDDLRHSETGMNSETSSLPQRAANAEREPRRLRLAPDKIRIAMF